MEGPIAVGAPIASTAVSQVDAAPTIGASSDSGAFSALLNGSLDPSASSTPAVTSSTGQTTLAASASKPSPAGSVAAADPPPIPPSPPGGQAAETEPEAQDSQTTEASSKQDRDSNRTTKGKNARGNIPAFAVVPQLAAVTQQASSKSASKGSDTFAAASTVNSAEVAQPHVSLSAAADFSTKAISDQAKAASSPSGILGDSSSIVDPAGATVTQDSSRPASDSTATVSSKTMPAAAKDQKSSNRQAAGSTAARDAKLQAGANVALGDSQNAQLATGTAKQANTTSPIIPAAALASGELGKVVVESTGSSGAPLTGKAKTSPAGKAGDAASLDPSKAETAGADELQVAPDTTPAASDKASGDAKGRDADDSIATAPTVGSDDPLTAPDATGHTAKATGDVASAGSTRSSSDTSAAVNQRTTAAPTPASTGTAAHSVPANLHSHPGQTAEVAKSSRQASSSIDRQETSSKASANSLPDSGSASVSSASLAASASVSTSPTATGAAAQMSTTGPTSTTSLSASGTDAAVRQVSDRLQLLAAQRSNQSVTVHLNPRGLGEVSVTVAVANNAIQTVLSASNSAVSDALGTHREEIESKLSQGGYASVGITIASHVHQASQANSAQASTSGQAQTGSQAQQSFQQSGQAPNQTFSQSAFSHDSGRPLIDEPILTSRPGLSRAVDIKA